MTSKVVDTQGLKGLIHNAERAGLNRTLAGIDPADFDGNGFHIVTDVMWHDHAAGLRVEPHLRCLVLVKVKGQEDPAHDYLDVSMEDFDLLPEAEALRDRLVGNK